MIHSINRSEAARRRQMRHHCVEDAMGIDTGVAASGVDVRTGRSAESVGSARLRVRVDMRLLGGPRGGERR
jgi:hypothetical protein